MRSRGHISIILIAATLIYLPITGHQLHTDDFTRISDNSTFNSEYWRTLFVDNKSDGFYRPVNHLSFGITYWLFGLNPYAYGVLNFILLASTSVVLFYIITRLTDDMGLATLLVVAWLSNVKVVASTIVWAVGRTSGLEMLFASCATLMVIKAGQSSKWLPILSALVFTALALLSKEGAVVLGPLLLAMATYIAIKTQAFKPKHIALLGLGLLAVYFMYFYLRQTSGAMTPDTAPDYYLWQLAPSFLLRNLGSYLERSLQFSIIIVPLIWTLAPKTAGLSHSIRIRAKWAILFMLLFAFTIAPALPVPSRSNLYPYLPSIFVVGTMASLMGYKHEAPQFGLTRRKLLLAVSVFVLVAVPISWKRGFDSYLRHGHTLAWANTIELEAARHGASSVCIKTDAMLDSARAADPLEWHFLRQALNLKHMTISVYIDEDCRHERCIVFDLLNSKNGFLAGNLKINEISTADSPATANGLPKSERP